jgi:hypothetical protein
MRKILIDAKGWDSSSLGASAGGAARFPYPDLTAPTNKGKQSGAPWTNGCRGHDAT